MPSPARDTTMTLDDLDTPALLLDEQVLARNVARMQQRMDALGVRLRPHVKTSKCVEVARLQREAGARGITVSTLKEAEQFFAAGFDDIVYAVAIAPARVARAAALRARGCDLAVLVDSVDAARAVAAGARAAGVPLRCLIEIDSDGHRAGVAPDDPVLGDIAAELARGPARLAGVLAHAGSSYSLDEPQALAALAEQERSRCVAAAHRLREAGHECPIVSVGSTPTALSARDLSGVTEVRAGVYAFFDLVMANVGVCALEDIAISVLTTVIGHRAIDGKLVVDAGWMAMSRDRGTHEQRIDYGYGAICDAHGLRLAELRMESANQEHGIVARRDGEPIVDAAGRFPVGTRLRVLPNHACATATQHDEYQLLRDGRPAARWPRFHGW